MPVFSKQLKVLYSQCIHLYCRRFSLGCQKFWFLFHFYWFLYRLIKGSSFFSMWLTSSFPGILDWEKFLQCKFLSPSFHFPFFSFFKHFSYYLCRKTSGYKHNSWLLQSVLSISTYLVWFCQCRVMLVTMALCWSDNILSSTFILLSWPTCLFLHIAFERTFHRAICNEIEWCRVSKSFVLASIWSLFIFKFPWRWNFEEENKMVMGSTFVSNIRENFKIVSYLVLVVFTILSHISSIPHFLRIFIMRWWWILPNIYYISVKKFIYIFVLHCRNKMCCAHLFMLSQSCIPAIWS